MVVRDYISFSLFLKFLDLAELLCHFCPILTSKSRIGQKVEHPKQSQQSLVSDHLGHPVNSDFESLNQPSNQLT